MSRPRPPLHDPYGLLRPPPPLDSPRDSFYSATNSNLGSTVSLPLPPTSPGRRNRQRGVSPSRVQHGEEYDDQPYLTNVVRHHGQLTLVPPINQGRARKLRRRRNPEAAASTTSLVEPGAQPVNASGSSRLDAETPTAHRSPRRPRHGSDTRAVSTPDVHSSLYPDYPPPSFEEVLALDRAVVPNTSTQTITELENSTPSQPSPTSVSVISTDSPRPTTATSTAWEEDRRLGLSLEERVRRELERNLKSDATEISAKITVETAVNDFPSENTPPPTSCGTPTSVAASNFLTPQNLTPSPLGIPLPLSNQASPQVEIAEPRSPSLPAVPPKSPAPKVSQPVQTPSLAAPQPISAIKTQTLGILDQPVQTSINPIFHSDEQAAPQQQTLQTISQGSPPKSTGPLASLLFTSKLNFDGPSTVETPHERAEPTLDQEDAEKTLPLPSSDKGKLKEISNGSPVVAPPIFDRSATPRAASPRKLFTKPTALDEPPASSSFIDSTPRPLITRRPISLNSPIKPDAEVTSSSPSSLKRTVDPSLASTLRKPPPPPPPRPRSMGAGIAARISAYESILANAPKVPPPIPPRPGDRQRGGSNASKTEAARESNEKAATIKVGATRVEQVEDAHTANTPRPRPTSLFVSEPGPSQAASRPLPMPPTLPVRSPSPERPRRGISPERPKSPTKQVQAQALVPARIGPDGKLEIIPDAGVIWLDDAKVDISEDSNATYEHSSSEEGHDAPVAPAELVAGPSVRRIPPPPPLPRTPNIPVAPVSSPGPQPAPIESIISNPFSPPTESTPVLPAAPAADTPRSVSSPRLADDFEYTDLDLLISRLEENEAARQGANYEQLLTVGEVLGPAVPRTRAELDLNVGLIEIQRRRVMKDGRVKLKLSLMGVSVDKCGVCLTQFKNNDNAVLLPCLHSYHTNCIMSWFVRQDVPVCPHCRAPV